MSLGTGCCLRATSEPARCADALVHVGPSVPQLEQTCLERLVLGSSPVVSAVRRCKSTYLRTSSYPVSSLTLKSKYSLRLRGHVSVHEFVARLFIPSDRVLPVRDVLMHFRDGIRSSRGRDLLHKGSICLGTLGIVLKCEQSPGLASATLSYLLVGIHVVPSCADQDVLVCIHWHVPCIFGTSS